MAEVVTGTRKYVLGCLWGGFGIVRTEVEG